MVREYSCRICPQCQSIMIVSKYDNVEKLYRCCECNYIYDDINQDLSGYWYDNIDSTEDNIDVINAINKIIKIA